MILITARLLERKFENSNDILMAVDYVEKRWHEKCHLLFCMFRLLLMRNKCYAAY